MSKDQFQDKYDEVFQELKKEKMDWDFDDFLKKTEENQETKVLPIVEHKKQKSTKIYWLAASIILLICGFFGIKFWNQNQNIESQNVLVENQIQKQKSQFAEENNQAIVQQESDSLELERTKEDSLDNEVSNPEKILDQIVPKRGRINKKYRERYADNSTKSKLNSIKTTHINSQNNDYQSNYVIVNGKKIADENQAIQVTKEAFQIIASNVTQTINETKVMNEMNIEF